jgi:hypothetical protein
MPLKRLDHPFPGRSAGAVSVSSILARRASPTTTTSRTDLKPRLKPKRDRSESDRKGIAAPLRKLDNNSNGSTTTTAMRKLIATSRSMRQSSKPSQTPSGRRNTRSIVSQPKQWRESPPVSKYKSR